MRFVWPGRRLQIPWEGSTIQAQIQEIGDTLEKAPLESTFSDLSINDGIAGLPAIWVAGWNIRVDLVSPDEPSYQNQGIVGELGSDIPSVSPYDDIGGLNPQINIIRDLVEIPLTRPSLFTHFNLKPPRGLLLHGPPGTGKTHLARAIAASTKSNVIVVNGPELSSAYHGETEKRLREVFNRAEKTSPCIVVLDEIDAICPKREDGGEGGEVGKRVVATLLTILDGMDKGDVGGRDKAHVVVIGTTNRPNAIDPALRRPGRFDRELEIGEFGFPLRSKS
ncbi:AAA+-type ATPase [Serendipita sp. 400]|nr:AAA+-type ATPase [Serendipita sp. 400]